MNLGDFIQKHGYEDEGIWYPRVTSICSILPKPGLEKWIANHGSFNIMQKRRKNITDWGTLVDSVIKQMLKGESASVSEDIKPSINAFLDFLDNTKVNVIDTDKKVKSIKHIYIGTLDVLCEIENKIGILDIKTSTGVWDEYFVQTAAYFEAYNEKGEVKAETHWILRIDQYEECKKCGAQRRKKSGVYEIRKGRGKEEVICSHVFGETKGIWELKEVDNHVNYLNAFLNAKKLWEFSNRVFLSKIENYLPNINKKLF